MFLINLRVRIQLYFVKEIALQLLGSKNEC
jgi:hypothetical protein